MLPREPMIVTSLKNHDQVDEPIGRAVFLVRRAKPVGQHAVFRHAIQHAVRANDGRVDRARQHQEADQHDERLEDQLRSRPDQDHRQPGNQVVRYLGRSASGMIATRRKRPAT